MDNSPETQTRGELSPVPDRPDTVRSVARAAIDQIPHQRMGDGLALREPQIVDGELVENNLEVITEPTATETFINTIRDIVEDPERSEVTMSGLEATLDPTDPTVGTIRTVVWTPYDQGERSRQLVASVFVRSTPEADAARPTYEYQGVPVEVQYMIWKSGDKTIVTRRDTVIPSKRWDRMVKPPEYSREDVDITDHEEQIKQVTGLLNSSIAREPSNETMLEQPIETTISHLTDVMRSKVGLSSSVYITPLHRHIRNAIVTSHDVSQRYRGLTLHGAVSYETTDHKGNAVGAIQYVMVGREDGSQTVYGRQIDAKGNVTYLLVDPDDADRLIPGRRGDANRIITNRELIELSNMVRASATTKGNFGYPTGPKSDRDPWTSLETKTGDQYGNKFS